MYARWLFSFLDPWRSLAPHVLDTDFVYDNEQEEKYTTHCFQASNITLRVRVIKQFITIKVMQRLTRGEGCLGYAARPCKQGLSSRRIILRRMERSHSSGRVTASSLYASLGSPYHALSSTHDNITWLFKA